MENLLSLAGRVMDETFVAERRRIGEIHERVGLEPRFYLGDYALYLSLLTPIVCNGLGLMVAHGIVKDHGGSICVESRVGKGTEFWIELPPATDEPGRSDEPG